MSDPEIVRTPEEEEARDKRLQRLSDAASALGLEGDRWSSATSHAIVLKEQKSQAIHGVCRTCRHSVIFRRPHGDPRTFCKLLCDANEMGKGLIPNDIEWCSDHTPDRETMTMAEMERLAIVIDPRPAPPQTNAYL